jgi:hypothetical protein
MIKYNNVGDYPDIDSMPVGMVLAEYNDTIKGQNVNIKLQVVLEKKYFNGENVYDAKDISPEFTNKNLELSNQNAQLFLRRRGIISINIKTLEFICTAGEKKYSVICDENVMNWGERDYENSMELIAHWIIKD